MSNSRIPAALEQFIIYVMNANAYLHQIATGESQPKGIILGMMPHELEFLDSFLKSLISDDPEHPGIWDIHKNKDTKNLLSRKLIERAMKEFGVFFQPILERINGSAEISAEDRFILRIAAPVKHHRRPTAKISEPCIVDVKNLGGGDLLFKCYKSIASKRAGKPKDADCVQLSYHFSEPIIPADLAENQGPGKVKNKITFESKTPEYIFISTKAIFILDLDFEYMGKRIEFNARWYNSRHPDIAGTWSPKLSSVVS